MRRKLKYSSPEKLLYTVSQFFYQEGLSRSAIGRRLGISVTHVSRLLREALNRGVVEISVKAPRHVTLEREIAAQFDLLDVRVISSLEDEQALRVHLGVEAARLFGEVAKPHSSVGLGSGRTMYEMVKVIPERSLAIELFPLALVADRYADVRSVDAVTLVNTLWFKLRPEARALKGGLSLPGVPFETLQAFVKTSLASEFALELHERVLKSSALFFSASHLRKDSQLVDLASYLGLGFEDLQQRGVVGDYLFRTIARSGEAVPVGFDAYVLGPTLPSLRDAARDRAKAVVLVAGGVEKVPTIQAGLRARYFNTLVTDDETAAVILRAS